jgi:hypothetical protein
MIRHSAATDGPELACLIGQVVYLGPCEPIILLASWLRTNKDVAMKPTLQFRSNIVDGDMPYRAFSGLTLDIDGQAETHPNLLALAGYLVRQVLADLHPERIERAADVEPLLVGLNAHVRLDRGEMTAVVSDGPAPLEPSVATGLVLGTFMLASNEAQCVGVTELHQRLAPPGRLDSLREALNDPANAGVVEVISAMLPNMTVTLRSASEAPRTLAYPGLLTRQPRALIERMGHERYQVYLGQQRLHADQELFRVAEDILEAMLLALQMCDKAAGRQALLQRPDEWDRVDLIIDHRVASEALFMLQPQSMLPAYGRALRCVSIAPFAYLLDPEYQQETGELLWNALADRAARTEWANIQADTGLNKASTLLKLRVWVRLDVLRNHDDGSAELLASYSNDGLCEEAPLPAPVAATVAALHAALLGLPEEAGDLPPLASTSALPNRLDAAACAVLQESQPSRVEQSEAGFWVGVVAIGALVCFAVLTMGF